MKRFKRAEVWGSSLGGAVATVACDMYLKQNPGHAENHDSFHNSLAVFPPHMAQFPGLVGGKLDAVPSMRSLVQRGVKVTVLCHKKDPVIQEGARMIEAMAGWENVTRIRSERHGHANLSKDMLEQLHYN